MVLSLALASPRCEITLSTEPNPSLLGASRLGFAQFIARGPPGLLPAIGFLPDPYPDVEFYFQFASVLHFIMPPEELLGYLFAIYEKCSPPNPLSLLLTWIRPRQVDQMLGLDSTTKEFDLKPEVTSQPVVTTGGFLNPPNLFFF